MRRERAAAPEAIFVRREGAFAESLAMLGCLVGTGLLGVARYAHFVSVPYETVVYALGAGIVAGPIAGRFARWRAQQKLALTSDRDDLHTRLRAVALAEQSERRSFGARVAMAMAYAPALIACGLALVKDAGGL